MLRHMQESQRARKYDADKVASLIFGEQSDLFDMESAKNIYLTPTDFMYVRTCQLQQRSILF